jgi:hypothetical protein
MKEDSSSCSPRRTSAPQNLSETPATSRYFPAARSEFRGRFAQAKLRSRRTFHREADLQRRLEVADLAIANVAAGSCNFKPSQMSDRLMSALDCGIDCFIDTSVRGTHNFNDPIGVCVRLRSRRQMEQFNVCRHIDIAPGDFGHFSGGFLDASCADCFHTFLANLMKYVWINSSAVGEVPKRPAPLVVGLAARSQKKARVRPRPDRAATMAAWCVRTQADGAAIAADRHAGASTAGMVSGVKRTSRFESGMFASEPKRTSPSLFQNTYVTRYDALP